MASYIYIIFMRCFIFDQNIEKIILLRATFVFPQISKGFFVIYSCVAVMHLPLPFCRNIHTSLFCLLQLRQSLDAIANNMKLLPAHMRQYQAFDYVQKMVKGYLKVSGLVYQVPVTETLDFFLFSFFFLSCSQS